MSLKCRSNAIVQSLGKEEEEEEAFDSLLLVSNFLPAMVLPHGHGRKRWLDGTVHVSV